MKRRYLELIEQHFSKNRQMLFLMGPRQVGKTTSALLFGKKHRNYFYYNWDVAGDRELILAGPHAIADEIGLDHLQEVPLIIFDEIHKFKEWKIFLKGFFDLYETFAHIIVTGSARLDVIHRGGESLMGRYFPYRIHPLSVGELCQTPLPRKELSNPCKLSSRKYEKLLKFGGFPEPHLRGTAQFYNRWKKLRLKQLIFDEVKDLTQIQYLDQLELLAATLSRQVGQLTSFQSLARKLRCRDTTVRNWVAALKNLYYCFEIRPWTQNITRSLLKEPKYYLWDWSWCSDKGMRFENFVASHLLKSVHYWTDMGLGEYALYFLRDKEKREVDFLVTKNQEPWMMVEAKLSNNQNLSPSLRYFHEQLQPKHTFQVIQNMDFVDIDCFHVRRPVIVPAQTLLSQLL